MTFDSALLTEDQIVEVVEDAGFEAAVRPRKRAKIDDKVNMQPEFFCLVLAPECGCNKQVE